MTSVLKQWLRELPDPLMTSKFHEDFLEAARTSTAVIVLRDRAADRTLTGNENDRLRQIRLHERINDLPDPNYATLKYFMGHLHRCVSPFCSESMGLGLMLTCICDRIADYESENSMSIQNLAIVFGPTLFKQAMPGVNGNVNGMADAPLQNKVRLLEQHVIAQRTHSSRSQAIETILQHYKDIFVDEGDEEQGAEEQ